MSEAVQSPDPGPPLDATVAPRPLRGVIIPLAGLMAVLLLILVNAVLIRRHIASLPLNLVPATNAMAEHIEDLCRRSHLPPECLKRYEPIARHDAGAEWNEHAFEAGVPATITAENFIAALTYGMALQQVSLERTDAPQGRWTELCFSMLDRPFAVVRVMGGAERSRIYGRLRQTRADLPRGTGAHSRFHGSAGGRPARSAGRSRTLAHLYLPSARAAGSRACRSA
ncbi:MAG: hypothetical protein ACOX5J_03350 [Candidatus Hydrogenedentales bacterium]